MISRAGYTGEDGFEISVDPKNVVRMAEQIEEQKEVMLAGLGARDSLRLEAGMCLHGNDISESTNPAEAVLLWTVRKKYIEDQKEKYLGFDSLQ